MKFFFPDSQDQVDPGYDFVHEEYSPDRSRQHDDRYAHEVLRDRAYDGLLVSKSIVDGTPGASGKYTLPQRHRLYRVGVEQFFRLSLSSGCRLTSMGDCGAFSYVEKEFPPYTVDEVIDFYDGCGFDRGLSLDHVILGYNAIGQSRATPADGPRRRGLTLALAADFLRRVQERDASFEPVGVAQGWSADTMASSVQELQRMGYKRVALGGMAALKTRDLLECLSAVADVRRPDTELHLLGVTRCDHIDQFAAFGVTSFDSTSPFRQAFKDEKDNYYTLDATFTAVRVPQVDGNLALKRGIGAGQIDQRRAIEAEQNALKALRDFAARELSLDDTVAALSRYEEIHRPGRSMAAEARRTLGARPWEECDCGICQESGIDVIIFRGAERNKRRGFHNLAVFRMRLSRALTGTSGQSKVAAGVS